MAPRPEHIFIDVDGVLADFVGAVLSLYDVSPTDAVQVRTWDGIPGVINANRDFSCPISDQDMWTTVADQGPALWSGLDLFPWSHQVMQIVEDSGIPYSLLTSPTTHPASAQGKMEWVRRLYPHMLRRTIITPEKHLLARSNRLLIDDGWHNIDAWEAAGGPGYLWEMPWNVEGADHNGAYSFTRRTELLAGLGDKIG